MGQLIEVVFECPSEAAARCVCASVLRADVVEDMFTELAKAHGDYLAERAAPTAELPAGPTLKNLHVRVLRYEGDKLDIELNFDLSEQAFNGRSWQLALRDFSVLTAREAGVTSFFGGLEPAIDEDTRFFTGS